MLKKIITITMIAAILIPGLTLPSFSEGRRDSVSSSPFASFGNSGGGRRNFSFFALGQSVEVPKTVDESIEFGEKVLETAERELPGIFQRIWTEEVLPIWQRMWSWFKENIWSRIVNLIKPEVEKRKDYLKESFEREKEEMKEEIKTEAPKIGKSLWERFKELIGQRS